MAAYKLTHVAAIRFLSGNCPQDIDVLGQRLAIINLLARDLLEGADQDYLADCMESCGIELIKPQPDVQLAKPEETNNEN